MKKVIVIIVFALIGYGTSQAQFNVVWTKPVGVTIEQGESLKKGSDGTWNSGASSAQALPSNEDGWIELTVTDTQNKGVAVGFSAQDTDQNWASIEYGVLIEAEKFSSIQKGKKAYTDTYQRGDVFRIERKKGVISVLRNGVEQIKFINTVSAPLLVDASMENKNSLLSVTCSMNSDSLRIPIYVTERGDVGIGTTNTFGYKLAVNGVIGAKEVKVELDSPWPDYVFDPNYTLRSLQEIETYIKENNHLPEVPSATEIKKNGLSVGEMNRILLQKIEELTLHTIAQQKLIEKQNEINIELLKRIEKLEKN